MSYGVLDVPRFGGLNVTDDPQEVGAGASAIDLLDVDLDKRGRVRSRDGYTKWTSVAGAARFGRLFGVAGLGGSTTIRLFAEVPSTPKLTAFAADSTSVSSSTLASTPQSLTTFGSGSAEYVYGGVGTSTTTLLRWSESGGAFTYPASGYSGQYVAVQPVDNRLVLGRTADSGNAGRVRFSDAGTPETFQANNFVDLAPNDGSFINGMAVYNNQLLVFKSSKFAVFYGNSTDSAGNPVFNYRWVDTGVGMPTYWGNSACVAPHGVYFLGVDGVYLTTGGPPVKVSRALDPLFRGSVPATYSGSAVRRTISTLADLSRASLEWFNDRLYLTIATGSSTYNDRLFVLDPELGWLAWSIPAAGVTKWLPSPVAGHGYAGRTALYFSYATGTNDIGLLSSSATDDAGTAIASKYRTGFFDAGIAAAEKVVREWVLDGYGTVNVKAAVNDGSLGSAASVALGTSPAIAQGRDRRSVRGRNFSLELSASSGAWSVSRAVGHIAVQRPPGPKAT